MSPPLVSAIIVFRDAEAFIDEAIRSVLAQTYRPLEIVMVDDGSVDGGSEIASRRVSDHVRLLRQPPLGVGPARNAALASARGVLIAFCDADDVWEPEKTARQVAALEADESLAVVLAMVREFLDPGIAPESAPVRPATEPLVGAIPSAFMARREVIDVVGPFDDSLVGQWTDWYARLVESGARVEVVPEVLVRRRIHGANLGLLARGARHEYLHALKASLDRRRAAG